MANPKTFRWHKGASLFAGPANIPRPVTAQPEGFRNIRAHPLGAALAQLADALVAGDAFCLSDLALPAECHATAPDFFTLTGGSTGTPNIIHRSQASWIASFEINGTTFGVQRHSALAVLGHLGHSLALYGVLEGLHSGLDVHVLAGLGPAQQRQQLRKGRIGVLYATPTQLRLLAADTATPLTDVALVFCGGGALDAVTISRINQLCPNAALRQFYGAAETSFVTITNDQTPVGSVGRAYPGVDIALQEGEIFVRSPYLFKGYASGSAPCTQWHNGFVSVGELGRQDAAGNLWITGRKSRQINIADQLVSPEIVENHVMQHPLGGPCAAVPMADGLRGKRLVLVLEGAEDTIRAQALKQSCHDTFGPLIAPRSVVFKADLPSLPAGKVDIRAVYRWLEAEQ